MSKSVWTALAENLEQQVANNQRVIEGHLIAHMKQGAKPDDLRDPLIEDLRATNAQLRELAKDARARIVD
jgi:hypothetical protein